MLDVTYKMHKKYLRVSRVQHSVILKHKFVQIIIFIHNNVVYEFTAVIVVP